MAKTDDTWVAEAQRAAAIIAAIEIAHPNLPKFKAAAAPYLRFVRGLGKEEDQ